jgi:hypothetical protein
MEGFHLFQEKIKGEVTQIKSNDPQILCLRTESLSGWDVSELEVLGNRYLETFSYQDDEEYNEYPIFINFSLEYSAVNQDLRLHLEDFRDGIASFNNDVDTQGKHTIIMFYD